MGCCSRAVVDLHEAMDNTLVWGSQRDVGDFPSENFLAHLEDDILVVDGYLYYFQLHEAISAIPIL